MTPLQGAVDVQTALQCSIACDFMSAVTHLVPRGDGDLRESGGRTALRDQLSLFLPNLILTLGVTQVRHLTNAPLVICSKHSLMN